MIGLNSNSLKERLKDGSFYDKGVMSRNNDVIKTSSYFQKKTFDFNINSNIDDLNLILKS